jgi:nucleotide-binding universal stress UspA family protein
MIGGMRHVVHFKYDPEASKEPVMVKRILAATDFSTSADTAWHHALDLAEMQGAELLLLHIAVPLPPRAAHPQKRQHERQIATARRLLDERTAAATARGLPVKAAIATGEPAAAILTSATDERVDLIVIGGHQPANLDTILVGSVAERVVRGATCAVLVVKTDTHRRAA